MSTAVLVILLVVFVAATTAVMVVEARRRRVFEWRRLDSGGVYLLPVGYSGPDVNACLESAVRCLKRHTNFPASAYDSALPHVSVVVMASEKWQQVVGGAPVGGETERTAAAYVVKVGRDVSALCHELAHVLEYATGGEPDYTHAGWTDRNIWAADEEYRAWLKEAAS